MAEITTTRKRGTDAKKVAAIVLTVLLLYAMLSLLASAVFSISFFSRADLPDDTLELRYGIDVDPAAFPRRAVRFACGPNVLQGYVYGEGEPEGLVVIAHGRNGGADSHLAEMMYFVRNGFAVFCFDGTGVRSSTGDSVVGLGQMRVDLLAALDYVRGDEALCSLPVVLYGHSMGAYGAAAALCDAPEVRAAVCISGFDAPVELMYRSAKRYVGLLADLSYPFLYLQNLLDYGPDAELSATASINASDAAVLIVHGSADEAVPMELSIYGHAGEIEAPDAYFLLVEEEPRNGHSTEWLTREAAAYILARQDALDELHSEYGRTLPTEVLADFRAETDEDAMHALDPAFMAMVLSFYRAAV